MHIHSLGPHTFITPPKHERRPDWLGRFKPSERRALIKDDEQARMQIAAVLGGAMLFGLLLLLVAVLLSW